MPIDLNDLLDPSATAVVSMDLQRGVVGDLSALPEIATQAEGMFPAIRRLLEMARSVNVPVVHCLAGGPIPGARPNYPLATVVARRSGSGPRPDAASQLVDAIGALDSDNRVFRHHGVSPFTGTELDAVLRALNVKTVVACGVSLNLGIIGLAIEAVGLGYQVVVCTDCVAGVPADYGESVLQNSVRLVATLMSSAAVSE